MEENTALAEAQARYAESKLTGEELVEQRREKAARAHLLQSYKDRQELHDQGFNEPALPTGIRLKSTRGKIQDIMDDGSIRNLWKRAPGVSGRQFRKARKVAQKNWRVQQQEAMKPVTDLLPVITGHRHVIGPNLLPSCGCNYTPEALAKLRAMVAGSAEEVSPATE